MPLQVSTNSCGFPYKKNIHDYQLVNRCRFLQEINFIKTQTLLMNYTA